jgi:DNA polymerase V
MLPNLKPLKNQRRFALVDCNNFYASCERAFNPKLSNRPVVVLSNNDGCIIARSNEAKALGIKMGEPYFQARELLKKNQVAVFSSNYELYGDMSRRVMQLLGSFTPQMEIYSIDEAFLDLSDFAARDFVDYDGEIRQTIKRCTGIPVSIGIACTKTLAKIANHLAKVPGVIELSDEKSIIAALQSLEVRKIWGVGRNIAAELKKCGIDTALSLRNIDDSWMRKKFGVVGLRMVYELRGIPCLNLHDSPEASKSLVRSRSFPQPIYQLADLQAAVSEFTSLAAETLREQQTITRTITVYILTDRFAKHDYAETYYNSKTIELPEATNITPILLHHALLALQMIYRPNLGYKKAGVYFGEILPDHQQQQALQFIPPSTSKTDLLQKLMKTIDRVNQRMGSGTIQYAVTQLSNRWHMRRAHRSPLFTTAWDELPVVKAMP